MANQTYLQNIEKATDLTTTLRYFGSLHTVMYCDFWNALPVDGRPYMQKVEEMLSRQSNAISKSPEMVALADYFKGLSDDDYENLYDRALGQRIVRGQERSNKVPLELRIEMSNFTSEAQMVWQDAMKTSDFEKFRPWLRRAFELKKRYADAVDPNRNPYDVLVGEVDEGLDVAGAQALFAELRDGIVDILQKCGEQQAKIDKSILDVDVDLSVKKELAYKAALLSGFNPNRGTITERLHPTCAGVGPRDCRPTANYTTVWSGIT
ncbi:MAG: hypothetical protein IJC58_06880, partial [Oscillospiraceae bacterium]|nr:hypothetical protein [Oscillospiraceae bacterium]